ncbi:MAG: Jag N-terminal domain-containing protein [Elusimicrobia bacterium]|nr:Jag N-terminal domain-containing protein [Elusimicrobiota bacterium]
MIEEMESEGKTVAEAVDNALKQWGLPREQVEVQILQEASSGILGFGAKPARVKVTRKHWGTPTQPTGRPAAAPRGVRERPGPASRNSGGRPPRQARPEPRREPHSHAPAPAARAPQHPPTPPRPRPEPAPLAVQHSEHSERSAAPAQPVDPVKACAASEEILKELLGLMLFTDANVASKWDPEQERVKTNVRTAEADRLIGLEGKVLESLQFLMTLMVSRRVGTPVAVQVDTNDYWQKKENEILSQVLKGVETVRNTGKPFRMQPMEPPLRRLVHKSLANHPDIMTSSEGDGLWRKVVLRLRG